MLHNILIFFFNISCQLTIGLLTKYSVDKTNIF